MRIFHLLTIAAILAAPVALHATPITYTQSFIGSGSLGSTSFTNQLVTLTGAGDTDNVTSVSSGFGSSRIFTNIVPITFSIAGGPGGTFTDEMQFVANNRFPVAGVGDLTTNAAVMLAINSVFSTYDLTTALGPITGAPLFNSGASFATDGGAFSIISTGDPTFQATTGSPVPEPASLALLGTGALGALGLLKRKFFVA